MKKAHELGCAHADDVFNKETQFEQWSARKFSFTAGYIKALSESPVTGGEAAEDLLSPHVKNIGNSAMVPYNKSLQVCKQQELIIHGITEGAEQWEQDANDWKRKYELLLEGGAVGGMEVKFLKWVTDSRYIWEDKQQMFVAAWDNYEHMTHEQLFAEYLSTLPKVSEGEGKEEKKYTYADGTPKCKADGCIKSTDGCSIFCKEHH